MTTCDISTLPVWTDIHQRSYSRPTVVRFRTPTNQFSWGKPDQVLYAVCGTEYGYIHTTSGDVRTWNSYSGARSAAKRYSPL